MSATKSMTTKVYTCLYKEGVIVVHDLKCKLSMSDPCLTKLELQLPQTLAAGF